MLTAVRDPERHTETALDRTYMLGPDYEPPDLVQASADERIRGIVRPSLDALLAAAAAAGHRLVVVSAYRSYDEQRATFDQWVSVGGYEQALRTSARAGHSEHQLGTAVDLGDGTRPPWEYEDWAAMPAGAWVVGNAERFGFVMSYPRGSEGVACYEYESWHYRWVGTDLAAKLRSMGLTLREYQAQGR